MGTDGYKAGATDDVAQLLAGRRVEVTQAVESSPHENAVHGGWRDRDAMQPLEVGGKASGPVLGLPP
ncbi:hypothetical protein [Streptomyces regalis]|uniref:Uncharacterized protein n=1 Tax=Streptomyces regalis TaxID=68262 RepID=A0A101JVC3_9ACTN|nr:hypothetical protein [Streptomyces regalis]KUL33216.1 hypothetical protein ADL12_22115 [Streptomyces regalis]